MWKGGCKPKGRLGRAFVDLGWLGLEVGRLGRVGVGIWDEWLNWIKDDCVVSIMREQPGPAQFGFDVVNNLDAPLCQFGWKGTRLVSCAGRSGSSRNFGLASLGATSEVSATINVESLDTHTGLV